MENPYSTLLKKEIKNDLLLTEGPSIMVTVPGTECILGDKLTAFAPHTTGIPLGQNKELEIMKQMFDIAKLADYFNNQEELWETYDRVVAEEIAFRDIADNRDSVLHDTIRAAACIIGKGATDAAEFPLFIQGAKSLDSHVLYGKFSRSWRHTHILWRQYIY